MASSSRKRRCTEYPADDHSDLIIKLADAGATSLSAQKHLLLTVSSCVRGLPADAIEWDLSQLRIEGQLVSRDVVVAWLDAAHMCINQEPYESEQQKERPLAATAAGLAVLLAFADAMGSGRGVLAACLSQLEQLQFCVQAGQQELQLSPATAYVWDQPGSLLLRKMLPDLYVTRVRTLDSEQHKTQLKEQFATQLEGLLYLAHKLQLPRLVDLMHSTVNRNSTFFTSLLYEPSDLATVLSERVLLAAAGLSQPSRVTFINSLKTQPAAFVTASTVHKQFMPVGLTQQQKQPITFKAELADDFMATGNKGKVVDVELDLFNTSTITIGAGVGSASYTAQLLIGPLQYKNALARELHLTPARGVQ